MHKRATQAGSARCNAPLSVSWACHWGQDGPSLMAVLTCMYEGHEGVLAECCHGDRIDDHCGGSQSKQEHRQSLGMLFEACTCIRDTSVPASFGPLCMQRRNAKAYNRVPGATSQVAGSP